MLLGQSRTIVVVLSPHWPTNRNGLGRDMVVMEPLSLWAIHKSTPVYLQLALEK